MKGLINTTYSKSYNKYHRFLLYNLDFLTIYNNYKDNL